MNFYLKNIIAENTNVISRPIFKLTEINDLYEKINNEINTNLKISKNIFNSFLIKNTLSPDIWENDKLKPEIKKNLIKICNDFFKNLELPEKIKVKDILIVGSIANYNWSKFSDVDLHIVVDFSQFNENKEFVRKFFDANKNLFNIKHDITVSEYPVEIYVQDVEDTLYSSAIYSLLKNKWIIQPEKENFILDKETIKRKVLKIFAKLDAIKDDYNNQNYQKTIDNITNLKNSIKKMRQSGLESGGEYSIENLIFKILRRSDFIEILDNYKNKAYDKLMSLEENIP